MKGMPVEWFRINASKEKQVNNLRNSMHYPGDDDMLNMLNMNRFLKLLFTTQQGGQISI